MSGEHSEIWDYIMATRVEAGDAEERISKLETRIAGLEERLTAQIEAHRENEPHVYADGSSS